MFQILSCDVNDQACLLLQKNDAHDSEILIRYSVCRCAVGITSGVGVLYFPRQFEHLFLVSDFFFVHGAFPFFFGFVQGGR